jgi:hypothetical protein
MDQAEMLKIVFEKLEEVTTQEVTVETVSASELDEIDAEPPPVGLLVGQGFLELLGRDALLLEKKLPNANGHESFCLPANDRICQSVTVLVTATMT